MSKKSHNLSKGIHPTEQLPIAFLQGFLSPLFDQMEEMDKAIKLLQNENQGNKERLTTLEELHAEAEDQKDKSRGWGYEPDCDDDDCCSKEDSLERKSSEERRGS